MIHDLKTWKEFFDLVWSGEKTFELRKDDRGFGIGHLLCLKEYLPDSGVYTGREVLATITNIISAEKYPDFGLQVGYVILSFKIERLIISE